MNKQPWIDYINWSNDESVYPYYRSLIEKVSQRAYEIMQEVDVTFTEEDPYSTSIEMRKDLRRWMIKIFAWWWDQPVFTIEENNLFILVHDVDWHGHD